MQFFYLTFHAGIPKYVVNFTTSFYDGKNSLTLFCFVEKKQHGIILLFYLLATYWANLPSI